MNAPTSTPPGQPASILRKQHTGEPGNPGEFARAPKAASGLDLSLEKDTYNTVLDMAENSQPTLAMLTSRGYPPEAAARISAAAQTTAAFAAADGIDRALDLDPNAEEAIIDIEEFLTSNRPDRYDEDAYLGYDYQGWTDALVQAWRDRTREIVAAETAALNAGVRPAA